MSSADINNNINDDNTPLLYDFRKPICPLQLDLLVQRARRKHPIMLQDQLRRQRAARRFQPQHQQRQQHTSTRSSFSSTLRLSEAHLSPAVGSPRSTLQKSTPHHAVRRQQQQHQQLRQRTLDDFWPSCPLQLDRLVRSCGRQHPIMMSEDSNNRINNDCNSSPPLFFSPRLDDFWRPIRPLQLDRPVGSYRSHHPIMSSEDGNNNINNDDNTLSPIRPSGRRRLRRMAVESEVLEVAEVNSRGAGSSGDGNNDKPPLSMRPLGRKRPRQITAESDSLEGTEVDCVGIMLSEDGNRDRTPLPICPSSRKRRSRVGIESDSEDIPTSTLDMHHEDPSGPAGVEVSAANRAPSSAGADGRAACGATTPAGTDFNFGCQNTSAGSSSSCVS